MQSDTGIIDAGIDGYCYKLDRSTVYREFRLQVASTLYSTIFIKIKEQTESLST